MTLKDFGVLIRADRGFKKWSQRMVAQRTLRGLDSKGRIGTKKITKLILQSPKIKDIEKELLSEKINLRKFDGI